MNALLAVVELPEDDTVKEGEFAEDDAEIEHFTGAGFSPLSYLSPHLPLPPLSLPSSLLYSSSFPLLLFVFLFWFFLTTCQICSEVRCGSLPRGESQGLLGHPVTPAIPNSAPGKSRERGREEERGG